MENVPLIDPPIQSMTLADGRHLTWQEFGLPDGRPVLYFHGGGSLSLEGGIFHREAVQRNIRLIATNRPGASGSTLCPGRPVAAYSNDLHELLDNLRIEKFACLGESNGGLVTLAIAATMAPRVLGAVPINPTVPWFDPLARSVSSSSVAIGYRLVKYWPWIVIKMAANSASRIRRQKSEIRQSGGGFDRLDLVGPPPGIEQDVGDFQWRVMEHSDRQALQSELEWATSNWGFDYYAIPTALDFFCGAYDSQAPFALVLADRNANAGFHYFSYGHYGFSHPDARRRILDKILSYFES
jgi:pimeloyl-ACP methyl ester carboxylesterase